MIVRTVDSSRIVFTASQPSSLSVEIVGRLSAGSTASTASRLIFSTLSIKPTLPSALIAPSSSIFMSSSFWRFSGSFQESTLAINWVLDSSTVSMMRSLLARSEEPVSVTSTMASASSGGFTSVAPQLNSTFAVTPLRSQITLGRGDQFRRDDLALQILHGFVGRRLGHRQHPAHFAEALLGVDEVGDVLDLGFVLLHPVAAGEAGIEHAVFDVARHLLRADQHAFDFGIVNRRKIRAAAGGDLESGAAEQIDRGVFQTAFGNSEFEFHDL